MPSSPVRVVASISVLFITIINATAPNILFLLIDDLGWGNIGYNSPTNTEIETPNINNLATKEGLILNRHYVHYSCSPTRTSFQSGRLPVHINLSNGESASNQYSGAAINMTLIAEKLKYSAINYATAFVGKWDAGSSTPNQLPVNRGYDSSFGYLSHANTYFTNYEWAHPCQKYGFQVYDLWDTHNPAYNDANDGEFEEFKFAKKVYNLIDNYDNSTTDNPFFIVYASHLSHDPLQIDEAYYNIFGNDESKCSDNDPYIYPGFNGTYHCRSVVQSMVNLLDVIVGNLTRKLKARNLWDNTLIIFTGDNGGCQRLNICGGNSHPLRGGKFVPFEGGIRTVTFASGGYLPPDRYGKVENGMIHIADWYATFCEMNGIDATDYKAKAAGLPPIDGYNIWDLLSGKNETSPRTELPIDEHTLIQNEYKLIIDTVVDYAGWGGVLYPNSSSVQNDVEAVRLDCLFGCLFDVVSDMTEHKDIMADNVELAQEMHRRLVELKQGYYNNNESGIDICPEGINMSCACWAAQNIYHGFYGPYQIVQNNSFDHEY